MGKGTDVSSRAVPQLDEPSEHLASASGCAGGKASGTFRGVAKAMKSPWAGLWPRLNGVSSGSTTTPSRMKQASLSGMPKCSHQAFIILDSGEDDRISKRTSLG